MINNAPVIIQSADIVSTIQKFVELKRAGTNYTGHSPFNAADKTPSFVVSPRKQIYKCFSTGKGGDVVSFLMEYKGMTFVEAVEYLAADSNIIIEYSQGANRELEIAKEKENKEIRKHLYDVMLKVHDSYSPPTPENESGLIHIAGKSYTPDIVAKWGMKTAGDYNHLSDLSRSWSTEDRSAIIDMGIIKANKKGDAHYDFFHHRLLFPLVDDRGHLVGYNGRITESYPAPKEEGKKPPKYINSPETSIYHKGKHLYGYFQNEREISRLKLALLVEGPTDVIGLDQAGIGYAVCSSGTAFTADQARILSRSADTVIICFDGDKAGGDAAIRAITTLLRAQLEVKVKELPEGHDPASYIEAKKREYMNSGVIHLDRKTNRMNLKDFAKQCINLKSSYILNGEKESKFINIKDASTYATNCFTDLPSIDAIEHAIATNFPNLKDATPTVQSGAVLLAASLISEISDKSIRDAYCQTLYRVLNITRKSLSDAVDEKIEQKKDATSKLTPEQEQMRDMYNIYIDKNCFINNNGIILSNFVINPLYLVSGAESTHRVFEIINRFGVSFAIKMHTDDLVTKNTFDRKVESLGNFLLLAPCKDDHYKKIKEFMYSGMETVLSIDTLGLHKSGFYAWSNGITKPDGKFQHVDEYGIVTYNDKKYFLPTFSKVGKLDDDLEDETNAFDKYFIYTPDTTGEDVTLRYIIHAYHRMFGHNAIIALSHYFMTVFMDVIYERQKFTPLLNIFGPPGSGKSFMAELYMTFFGRVSEDFNPVHLITSTISAFFRALAMAHNAPTWLEEYGNDMDNDKDQAIKQIYNHEARTISDKNNRKKTFTTKIIGSAVFTGQVMPGAKDPALPERTVSIYSAPYEREESADKFARRFEQRAKSGAFTQITALLFSWRPYFKEKYGAAFDASVNLIQSRFTTGNMPKYRFIANHATLLTMWILTEEKLKEVDPSYTSPVDDESLISYFIERIHEQSRNIENIEETAEYFKMVEYLINQKHLTPEFYDCAYVSEFKVIDPADPTKTIIKRYDDPVYDESGNKIGVGRKVLFIFMNHTHQLYSEHAKKQGIARIVNQNTMQHFLKIHKSYIGQSKGRRMRSNVRRAWAFDTTMLPNFDFERTDYKVDGDNPFENIPLTGSEGMKKDTNPLFDPINQ